MRIGIGHDTHRLAAGRPLILGGVRIEHDRGLVGHSDADVVLHALTDALLGAAGLGDIGDLFPDDDERYRDCDSRLFVARALEMIGKRRLRVGNVDVTIFAQEPKLGTRKGDIRRNVAAMLAVPEDRVNIKAKTGEKVGPIGRGEAIACAAAVLLLPADEAAQ